MVDWNTGTAARPSGIWSGRMSVGQKVGGFFLSTLESFPELFGIEPSAQTQRFRAVAPVSGFLSQAAGAFVPYLGAAKLARGAALTGRFIRGAEALAGPGRPFVSGALGMGAEAAVVEAGRIAIGGSGLAEGVYEGLTGRDAEMRSLGTLAGEGAFNVAGSALLGGGVGLVVDRLSRGVRIHDIIPDAAPDRPLTFQVRAMNEWLGRAQAADNPKPPPEGLIARVARDRDQRMQFIRMDIEPKFAPTGEAQASGIYRSQKGALYRPLEGQKKSNNISGFINRLARYGNPHGLTETRRLGFDPQAKGAFASKEAVDEIVNRATGLDVNTFSLYAMDARVIKVKEGVGKPKASTRKPDVGARREQSVPYEYSEGPGVQGKANGIERKFNNKLFANVGDGWGMAKEKDGLFVFRKKIQGEMGKPAPGDQWIVFRTDSPEVFAPVAANTKSIYRSAYFPEVGEARRYGDPMLDGLQDFKAVLRTEDVAVKQTATKLGAAGSMIREMGETVARKVVPSDALAAQNPLLNRIFAVIKKAERDVDFRVGKLMNGEQIFKDSKSYIASIADLDPPTTNGLRAEIKALTKDEVDSALLLINEEVPFPKVKEMFESGLMTQDGQPLVSEAVFKFLQRQQLYSDSIESRAKNLNGQLADNVAESVLGEFKSRKGHYAISQNFKGSYKVILRDENGGLLGLVPGNSAKEAQEAAEKIILDQAARGKSVFTAGIADGSFTDDLLLEMRKARKPGFLKPRGGLLGHELQQGNVTADRLADIVEGNIRQRENWFRQIAQRELLVDELGELKRTNPKLYEAAESFLRRSMGDEGPAAAMQNQAVDALTMGVFGPDSATKITKATQGILFQFSQNFGNVVHPILNIAGIAQTVMPEVAFALHASDDILGKYYLTTALMDSSNNVRGTVGVLSELKVMQSAFKRIWTPKENLEPAYRDFLERMIADRTLAPRVLEDEIGSKGAILKDVKGAFADAGSFVKFLGAANEILLTKTDEITRLVAASAAYDVGVIKGLSGERLQVFGAQMMAKMAFNMGTVDRAAYMTTPLGSLMGTFKNWMFHYMANMLRYADGGKGAMPALMWQTAATATIGGAAATPLVMPVADAFSKWATDKTAMEHLYFALGEDGQWAADGLLYGLPGTLGMSLSSSASSPGSDPVRDAQMIFSFAAFDRVKALSSAARDALVAAKVTGESPWEDEHVRAQMVRAFAPRTIYRSMAAARTTAVESLTTGYNVTQPLGIGGAALYAAGFNPTELERTYEAYNLIRNDQVMERELVSEYGQTLAQAWESGDTRLANRVFTRAMATGVDVSSVLRSAESRRLRGMETQLEYTAKPEDEQRYNWAF